MINNVFKKKTYKRHFYNENKTKLNLNILNLKF